MYVLLGVSVLAMTLCLERTAFWLRLHSPGRLARVQTMTARLSQRDLVAARSLADADTSLYGRFARGLLAELKQLTSKPADSGSQTEEKGDSVSGEAGGKGRGGGVKEAVLLSMLDGTRGPIERFSVLLSTIITAAPMLGILGTVTGIIESFQLLGGGEDGGTIISDPSMVAGGIAEALYTTAFGLVIALMTLFPYAIFRGQAQNAMARLETMASAVEGE